MGIKIPYVLLKISVIPSKHLQRNKEFQVKHSQLQMTKIVTSCGCEIPEITVQLWTSSTRKIVPSNCFKEESRFVFTK